jgi:hypothetical protein
MRSKSPVNKGAYQFFDRSGSAAGIFEFENEGDRPEPSLITHAQKAEHRWLGRAGLSTI